MNITITKTTHPGTLPPSDQLGFGTVFTDHMFLMDYSADKGWHDARVVPYGPITMSPAASVLHYAVSAIFRGSSTSWTISGSWAAMRCGSIPASCRPSATRGTMWRIITASRPGTARTRI